MERPLIARDKDTVGGILVGGASTRMGGAPKGLLRAATGETIVERWRSVFEGLGLACVLVGAREEYTPLGMAVVADDPPGIGPLGGLVALLAHAGPARAIAVACDMPHVSRGLVERLVLARSNAPIVAPRAGSRWQPLFARYDAARVLPLARRRAASGELSLQGLLDEAGAEPLALTAREEEELRDWDTPDAIGS